MVLDNDNDAKIHMSPAGWLVEFRPGVSYVQALGFINCYII